jgi:hypothetical protein
MTKPLFIGIGVWALVYYFAPAGVQTLGGMTSPLVGCMVLGAASGLGYMYYEQGSIQSGKSG